MAVNTAGMVHGISWLFGKKLRRFWIQNQVRLRIPYYHVCVGIVEADDVISDESISSLQQNTSRHSLCKSQQLEI